MQVLRGSLIPARTKQYVRAVLTDALDYSQFAL